MFDIGLPEFVLLAVAALFIFGPERLPQAAAQAAKMLKQIRNMANNARSELTNELGPEFGNINFEDLNPRTFIRKNLLEGSGLDTLKEDIGLSRSDVSLAMKQATIRVKSRGPTPERLEAAKKVVAGMGDRLPKTVPEVYARETVYLAQRPDGDITDTHWRYSLMNWGHDPKSG